MDLPIRSTPLRPLPQPSSRDQLLTYTEAKGKGSLLQMIDSIRMNMTYDQSRKAIRAGLRPATLYLSKKLREELPRSKHSKNLFRPSGSTAKSVRARLGAPPGRRGAGKLPIGRVVLVPPHGYVYNFLKGTGPRHAAVISHARGRGLWTKFQRGVGGWGAGAYRGVMPKVFDIDMFLSRHRPVAIEIMMRTFRHMINAFNLQSRPRSIRDYSDGTDL